MKNYGTDCEEFHSIVWFMMCFQWVFEGLQRILSKIFQNPQFHFNLEIILLDVTISI